MAEPARLCVTNQKGGVGKTTVAINLAGALNDRGRDVLFVDLDPQGNATEGLGLLEAYDAEPPTLLDALVDPDDVPREEIVYEHEEMDVVASNVDMNAAASTLAAEADAELRLDRLLTRLESESKSGTHDYDFVVVDCPPHLGAVTDNGLVAAQNLIIPALAEPTSKRSLELLFDYVGALEMDHDVDIEPRALVANRIENTNAADEMLEWFEDALPETPIYRVRKRVAFQRAFAAGNSIFAVEEENDMRDVFASMAATLDERLTKREVSA
ncbi:ParA family protein [Halobiforma nitratireducens]|uniref:Cobyrinic acid a,c-diamide synthase n=1 Tax=Halobiforma nitratireducens JCM 10879 TaxID=1227454 RepID=M0LJ00_9EURY|nr:ParA family protein [Halobiforma nitratireducens]EMA32414.1 cobyrinic acid a,c-diamide synthase [Halobiforma nitratireducens JCM 10879]